MASHGYGYTDLTLTLAGAVARQGETFVNMKQGAAGKKKRTVTPFWFWSGKAMRAMSRKLDASIVLKKWDESDADFKLRFSAAINLFGVEQIMVWHGDGAPSMLHAAIQNCMSSPKTQFVVHTLIDMGADVHVRGEDWFSKLRLTPLELCAYRLGASLKEWIWAIAHRQSVYVDENVSRYCDVLDHLKDEGAELYTSGHMSAYDCVWAGLREGNKGGDHSDDQSAQRAEFVLAIMANERFRRTFNLQDLSGQSAVDARAAVVEEYEVESEVAASNKKWGDYGEVLSVMDSALETESESDSEDEN